MSNSQQAQERVQAGQRKTAPCCPAFVPFPLPASGPLPSVTGSVSPQPSQPSRASSFLSAAIRQAWVLPSLGMKALLPPACPRTATGVTAFCGRLSTQALSAQ